MTNLNLAYQFSLKNYFPAVTALKRNLSSYNMNTYFNYHNKRLANRKRKYENSEWMTGTRYHYINKNNNISVKMRQKSNLWESQNIDEIRNGPLSNGGDKRVQNQRVFGVRNCDVHIRKKEENTTHNLVENAMIW